MARAMGSAGSFDRKSRGAAKELGPHIRRVEEQNSVRSGVRLRLRPRLFRRSAALSEATLNSHGSSLRARYCPITPIAFNHASASGAHAVAVEAMRRNPNAWPPFA